MKRHVLICCSVAYSAVADVTVGPGGKTVDCYCTDKSGSRVELGETICLQVDGRMFMAQCQMSLNVPMWREVQQGCLSSSLRRRGRPSHRSVARALTPRSDCPNRSRAYIFSGPVLFDRRVIGKAEEFGARDDR